MSAHTAAAAARRQAAAARFARASQASAIADEAEVASLEALCDYDAFLAARSSGPSAPQLPPAAWLAPTMPAIPPPVIPTNTLPVSSALAGQFGTPVPPRSARAANRRLFYMRRHLLAQDDSTHAAAAAGGSVNSVSASSAPAPARSEYFGDDEMERRRPGLFHEYVGQFRKPLDQQELDEDAADRARRQGHAADDEEEEENEEEEQKMGDAVQPVGCRRQGQGRAPPRDPAAHLPATLSQLLLANYDRAQLKGQRQAELSAISEPPNVGISAPALAPSPPPPTSVRHSGPADDDMLASDESELDDDGAVSSFRRPPAVVFSADDGRIMDVDGSDLREAGPTASAEYAEWARHLVDDDMDRKRATREMVDEVTAGAEQAESSPTAARAATAKPVTSHPDADADADADLDPDPASLRSEFLHLMQSLFLDGYDGAFVDYGAIDADDDNEDLHERERADQEAYFEADDEEQADADMKL